MSSRQRTDDDPSACVPPGAPESLADWVEAEKARAAARVLATLTRWLCGAEDRRFVPSAAAGRVVVVVTAEAASALNGQRFHGSSLQDALAQLAATLMAEESTWTAQ